MVDRLHGDAHYYSGLLDLKEKKFAKALTHFHQAARSFEKDLMNSQAAILKQVQKYPLALQQRLLRIKQARLAKVRNEMVHKLQIVLNAFHRSTSPAIKGIRAIVQKLKKTKMLARIQWE